MPPRLRGAPAALTGASTTARWGGRDEAVFVLLGLASCSTPYVLVRPVLRHHQTCVWLAGGGGLAPTMLAGGTGSRRALAMAIGWRPAKWLEKKAKRGLWAYPGGTLAFYGPDQSRATKAVAGIIREAGGAVDPLRRWFGETGDLRLDATVQRAVVAFFRAHGVRSVAMMDGIFGCPHEEGVDYPEGEACPQCPYWTGRNRFTGELEAG